MEHQTNSRLQIIPVKILSPFYPAKLRFREAAVLLPSPARSVSLFGNMVGSLTIGKKTYAAVEEDIIQCKKKRTRSRHGF